MKNHDFELKQISVWQWKCECGHVNVDKSLEKAVRCKECWRLYWFDNDADVED